MNKKIFGSIAAIIAVLGLIGGGTFAAWSDFQTFNAGSVGADTLNLVVNQPNGTQVVFDNLKLAPGHQQDNVFFVASRTGVSVPNANLTLKITDVVGAENGCDGNAEAPQQLADYATTCDAASTTTPFDPEGQFPQQGLVYIQSVEVASASLCNSSIAMAGRLQRRPIGNAEDVTVDLLNGTLANPGQTGANVLNPGEGVCVAIQVLMNNTPGNGVVANDAVQGDSASFNVRFDLTQA